MDLATGAPVDVTGLRLKFSVFRQDCECASGARWNYAGNWYFRGYPLPYPHKPREYTDSVLVSENFVPANGCAVFTFTSEETSKLVPTCIESGAGRYKWFIQELLVDGANSVVRQCGVFLVQDMPAFFPPSTYPPSAGSGAPTGTLISSDPLNAALEGSDRLVYVPAPYPTQRIGYIDGTTGVCTLLDGTVIGGLPAVTPANKGNLFECDVSGTPPSGPMAGQAMVLGDQVMSDGDTKWVYIPYWF
jgi:hypothetical protein